jgi:small subunit ribosomal protein S21
MISVKMMGGEKMPRVVVKENEDLDSAMRRFKRQVNSSGILAKVRSKEYYVKPGVRRRLKSEAARKKKRR